MIFLFKEKILRVGGIIWTIRGVKELEEWMNACSEGHPMFVALTQKELEADSVVKLLSSAAEEGQKVSLTGGQTFQAIYRCIRPSFNLEGKFAGSRLVFMVV